MLLFLFFSRFVTVFASSPAIYIDEFTRRKMWSMFRQAHTNSTACMELSFNKWEFAGQTVAHCDLEPNGPDTCAGATIVSHDDKAIILTFRLFSEIKIK